MAGKWSLTELHPGLVTLLLTLTEDELLTSASTALPLSTGTAP